MADSLTPGRLARRLVIYFATFFGVTLTIAYFVPGSEKYLPIGGSDIVFPWQRPEFATGRELLEPEHARMRAQGILLLSTYLVSTILLMLPISWVYMAQKARLGFQRNFVIMLFVLPICAAAAVMLIQDNLALAFGLAAMVAAVRFRVALADPLDGAFIFASIVVGLAAGIGYVGVAAVMSVFFCFTITLLWATDYGLSSVEEEKIELKRAKRAAERSKTD